MASKARDIADLGSNDVLETTATGVEVTGDVSLGDNGKAKFGAGDDLQIYHDGSNSFIKDTGDGVLFMQGSGGVRVLGSDTSENLARFNENSSVQLYYDNAEKLATTSTGVDVTGTVTADGFQLGAGDKLYFNADRYFTPENNIDGAEVSANGNFTVKTGGTPSKSLVVGATGDVQFFEDSGSTAKMVWDASAESLGINEASPGSNTAFGGGVKLQTTDDTNTGYTTTGSGRLPYGTQLSTYNIAASSSSLSGIGLLNRGSGGASMGSYIGSLGSSSGWGASIVFGMTSGSSSYTERMRIDSSGNVGIGGVPNSWSTVTNVLQMKNQTSLAEHAGTGYFSQNWYYDGGEKYIGNGYAIRQALSSVDGAWTVANASSNASGAGASLGWSERMRIDSSGRLLLGLTSGIGAETLNIKCKTSGGDYGVLISGNPDIASVTAMRFYDSGASSGVRGSITFTNSSTSYNTSSDERLKENIQDTTHTVDINDIQVREFDWKADGSHQRYGFIAQELETVYPEAVHSPEEADEMKSVDYSKLVPLLVKEIQNLKTRIETLENK